MSTPRLDVRYVAELARLELSDEECALFQPQLDAILSHAESLTQLDVEGMKQLLLKLDFIQDLLAGRPLRLDT